MSLQFELIAQDPHSKARAARLHTSHGSIETPIFMPVGTAGTVKAVQQRELLADIQAHIILGNTYHLYLRPGAQVLQNAGGLHKFMNWPKPILTDSGGFQAYSLSEIRKITEEGIMFSSHIDGSKHLFTPENVVDMQRIIGSDIMMAFDECTPYPCEYAYAKKSLALTHRWLKRCLDHTNNTQPLYGHYQALFPIVQGSTYHDLRRESASFVAEQNADGNAIGGLAVGEPAEQMYETVDLVTDILPSNKPRYLMGVGTPANLLEAIALGVDMFDCVMPTRNARNAYLFTTQGIINAKNAKWKMDYSPIDSGLNNYASQNFSKAYLRHLVISGEILGAQIASIHNLAFYLHLMKEARQHIQNGSFTAWRKQIIPQIMQKL
ncbi:MAG: tRNA guanosine(34) transglycosylase Tgt [Cytophagales bacterium]|nr:MAG: tRNA guanosine(34) transglycosylase Tgt [Cytophagales bacterium]